MQPTFQRKSQAQLFIYLTAYCYIFKAWVELFHVMTRHAVTYILLYTFWCLCVHIFTGTQAQVELGLILISPLITNVRVIGITFAIADSTVPYE
jgi:hypothetical protein